MSQAAQDASECEKSETGSSIMSRKYGIHTFEVHPAGSVDLVYVAMAQELNGAIQSIGMGRYQVSPSSFWFRMPSRSLLGVVRFCTSTLLTLYLPTSAWSDFITFAVAPVPCGRLWVFCGQPVPHHYWREPLFLTNSTLLIFSS